MQRPAILTFSGLDPSGGAGIAADVRLMARCGAHCLPVITTLTVQDTHNALEWQPVEGALIRRQVDALLADIRPAAIKIGLVSEPEQVSLIAEVCTALPDIPVVADPVLRAGGGGALGGPGMADAWRERLLPQVTLATPNRREFQRLFPAGQPQLAADHWLLVTGADAGSNPIRHELLGPGGFLRSFESPRLPREFHGSGCTLAAALAAELAHGHAVEAAVQAALDNVAGSLATGFPIGGGQWIPG